MTITELIEHYRRRIRDIDPTAYVQTDVEVALGLESARRQQAARRVAGMDTFAISSSPPAVVGAATDELGYYVAVYACWQYLSDEYQKKLTTGQFGIAWKSGLEEEDSRVASSKYAGMLEGLKAELSDWSAIINRTLFATRIQ